MPDKDDWKACADPWKLVLIDWGMFMVGMALFISAIPSLSENPFFKSKVTVTEGNWPKCEISSGPISLVIVAKVSIKFERNLTKKINWEILDLQKENVYYGQQRKLIWQQ